MKTLCCIDTANSSSYLVNGKSLRFLKNNVAAYFHVYALSMQRPLAKAVAPPAFDLTMELFILSPDS